MASNITQSITHLVSALRRPMSGRAIRAEGGSGAGHLVLRRRWITLHGRTRRIVHHGSLTRRSPHGRRRHAPLHLLLLLLHGVLLLLHHLLLHHLLLHHHLLLLLLKPLQGHLALVLEQLLLLLAQDFELLGHGDLTLAFGLGGFSAPPLRLFLPQGVQSLARVLQLR